MFGNFFALQRREAVINDGFAVAQNSAQGLQPHRRHIVQYEFQRWYSLASEVPFSTEAVGSFPSGNGPMLVTTATDSAKRICGKDRLTLTAGTFPLHAGN